MSSEALEQLNTALLRALEQQQRTLYRIAVLQDLVLVMLQHTAATEPAAARRIASQVRDLARRRMDERQAPEEIDAQASMLALLNDVLVAAGSRPEPPDEPD